MKKIVLFLTAFAAMSAVQAQVNITGAGFNYTQNFNTLDPSATNSSNLPSGWAIKEVGSSASVNNKYRSGYGSSNAGDVYSFGDSASTERALGSMSSGTNATSFGAKFMNTSNDTMKKFVITHKVEQWRAGDTLNKSDSTLFYYSMVADSVGDTLAANWTEVPSLMLHSYVYVSANSGGNALNGNDAANSGTISDSFALNIPPGKHLIIKWIDKNTVGSDDGLAIDDVSITFRGVSGPVSVANTNYAAMPLSILGASTSNQVNIGFSATEAAEFTLEIYDLSGRRLHAEQINAVAGTQKYTVNGMNLASGMYIVKLGNGTQFGVAKMIVQ